MNLWKKRSSLPEIDNLDVYLYVSVKNHSLNYLRDNHFSHTVDIEQYCNNYIQFDADPETQLVSTETVKAVLAVIDQLPPRCKLIFKLIKEDGLKYKDVAELLGLSVKTVEAQLAIAMKKIASGLKIHEIS
jgi:RNA polymerase sigma-70 factor (ECF subfamily)